MFLFLLKKKVTTQRDADRRIGERLGDEVQINFFVQNYVILFVCIICQTYWRGEIQSELEANLNFTHQVHNLSSLLVLHLVDGAEITSRLLS